VSKSVDPDKTRKVPFRMTLAIYQDMTKMSKYKYKSKLFDTSLGSTITVVLNLSLLYTSYRFYKRFFDNDLSIHSIFERKLT